jgi:hypothetical protein
VTAQKGGRTSLIIDLASGYEEGYQTTIRFGDRMQFGVHTTFGPDDHTVPPITWSPYFNRRLLALQCALR